MKGTAQTWAKHECQLAGQEERGGIGKRAGDNAPAGRSPSHGEDGGWRMEGCRECRELRGVGERRESV